MVTEGDVHRVMSGGWQDRAAKILPPVYRPHNACFSQCVALTGGGEMFGRLQEVSLAQGGAEVIVNQTDGGGDEHVHFRFFGLILGLKKYKDKLKWNKWGFNSHLMPSRLFSPSKKEKSLSYHIFVLVLSWCHNNIPTPNYFSTRFKTARYHGTRTRDHKSPYRCLCTKKTDSLKTEKHIYLFIILFL